MQFILKSVLLLHNVIVIFLVCVPEVTCISMSGKPKRQVMAISAWQLKSLCINMENSMKTLCFFA